MSSPLEAFISNWRSRDFASYKAYVALRDSLEEKVLQATTKIEEIQASVSQDEQGQYTEGEKSIIQDELEYQKIKLEAIKNLSLSRVEDIAEEVVREQLFLMGGGELMSRGLGGGRTEDLISFYNAIIAKVERSLLR